VLSDECKRIQELYGQPNAMTKVTAVGESCFQPELKLGRGCVAGERQIACFAMFRTRRSADAIDAHGLPSRSMGSGTA
jgi:hypothetical protein